LITKRVICPRYGKSIQPASRSAGAGAVSIENHFEALKQIAFADRIVLTKTDLAAGVHRAEDAGELAHELRELNPCADIVDRQAVNFSSLFFPRPYSQNHGQEMLRVKGIIAFENDDDRFVMQGVHMLLEGDHQQQWKADEWRTTRLVFIGRDLPREAFEEGFRKCVVQAQVAAG